MPRSPHEFYVYYDGDTVYARMPFREPIAAERYDTPQQAHDRVQEIVNPDGLRADQVDPRFGFHAPEFQAAISGRCEEFVRAAYEAAGVAEPAPDEGEER